MASDTSLGGLYINLGLSLSELETGFISASRTVRENMNRLNRESNLIRLRTEVEIGNLDETADALQILTIRENSLNQQMAIQRDRIRIADATWRNLNNQHGASAAVTQRAAAALERERLALQRLERELHDVQNAENDVNTGTGDLLDNMQGIIGKAAPVIAAVTAISSAFMAASESIKELRENFKEIQDQSYELNLPFDETKNLLRELKLAGGDIGDFEGYIRGITDAYVKGEFDDPEFIALSKYNAQITDATGKLKNFKEITDEVYQAYQKAKEAGEGIEFLQLTGGEMGVRDAIQFFERYKEAQEDAARVADSNINPEELHKLDRAFNLLTTQTDEFGQALGNIFAPAATETLEQLFEVVRYGTEFLVENKTEFQRWGFIAIETIDTVLNAAKNFLDSEEFEILKDIGRNILPTGITRNALGEIANAADNLFGITDRAEKKQIEYNNAINATNSSLSDFRRESEQVQQQGNPLNQYDTKRITQFKDELEDLRLELNYADDEFELAQAKNDLWMERELTRKNYLSLDEETAIRELHAEKQIEIERKKAEEIQKIEEESQNRIKALTEETTDIEYDLTHSSFEKQIRDIEKWKEAQIDKADKAEEVAAIVANAAAKEAEAVEREVDRLKGLTQSFEDEIFEMEHSQYEADRRRAIQKAQKALEEGVDPTTVQRWLNDKFGEIDNKARESRRNGGDYTRSPSNNRNDDWQILDFGQQAARENIGLMTDENKIRNSVIDGLSDESALRNAANNQYLQSTKDVTDAQSLLNRELQNGIAIIEGDQLRYGAMFQDTPQSYIRSEDEIKAGLPEIIREIEEGFRTGNIERVDDTFYSGKNGYGGDIHNFVQSMEELGMTTREAFAKLDEINASIRETAVEPNQNQRPPTVNVSPTVNIDLGGAYVFDNEMKKQLTEDIGSEVTDAVKDAFNSEVRSSSYNFGT